MLGASIREMVAVALSTMLLYGMLNFAFGQAVNLNTYLVFPTFAQAQARSQQQCQALNCDPTTIWWWNVVQLTNGTAAVEIQPSGFYSATDTLSVGPCAVGCGLTAAEQSALQTAAQLGSLLPQPSSI
jgi:hypothetical protein